MSTKTSMMRSFVVDINWILATMGSSRGEYVLVMLLAMALRHASVFIGGMSLKYVAVKVRALFDVCHQLDIYYTALINGFNFMFVDNANTATTTMYAFYGK